MILVERMTEILNYGKESLYLMVCLSILKSQTARTVIKHTFERRAKQIHQFLPVALMYKMPFEVDLYWLSILNDLSTQYLSLFPYMHLRFDTGWHLIKVLKCCPVFSKFLVRLWIKLKVYVSSFMHF